MASLFRAPSPPPVAASAPMPDPNSPAVLEAAKRQIATAQGRFGRASTVMGKQGQGGPTRAPVATAATDSYAGTNLGAANA